MLQLSLDLYYTEDEIYELSYTKEPKNPKIQVSLALVLTFFFTRGGMFVYFLWV